jgi:ABC-2 type transport system permease protein
MSALTTLKVAEALWRRDILRFKKERSRWIGLVSQPLMFWGLIGFGLNRVVSLPETGENYIQFFYSGSLVMCVLFTTLFGSISLIEDAQSGFLRAIIASPAPKLGIALGKVFGLISLVIVQFLILLIFAPLAGLSLTQVNWIQLATTTMIGTATLAGINLGAALLINSVQGFHAVMGLLLFPLWIVSGAMFPIPTDGALGALSALNPMSHIASLFRSALIPTVSGDVAQISIAVLLIQAALSLWFATAMIKHRRVQSV